MGGLKKELPITYWTFLIGALAIAGVPGLAGFFSKDEILFRTYAGGHTVLWVVGLLTSLLTAIYMFRLVFLAFHGERTSAAVTPEHQAPSHAAPQHSAQHAVPQHQAPSTHLHDAPPAMALALIVLAIGSIAAGYAGLSGRFEKFLEPSFVVAGDVRSVRLQPDQETNGDANLETTLMVVSSVVAVGGIGLAVFFFLARRAAADRVAGQFAGLHRVLEHKYYVDEIYDTTVVQPIRIVSEQGLWKGVDAGLIDGAVNGVGDAVRGGSEVLRRLQTGSVRAYAASLFLGVVLILGYYVWR